jgi:hypothetical protein
VCVCRPDINVRWTWCSSSADCLEFSLVCTEQLGRDMVFPEAWELERYTQDFD